MTFAVGMSRQPFKQSRVPRNVAAVDVSGTFHTERPRGLHLDCGRRACQSLNLCSVFSPAIANANWAVMAPRWCQLRMPGHTPSPGNKRPAARICRRHDAAHAQTYATQQIPEDSVISLRPPFDYACPDIHKPANTGEFRRSSALSIRSRMPRHTQPDRCQRIRHFPASSTRSRMPRHTPRIRNRHPTDHTRRRHNATHARTYATQQMSGDSTASPCFPSGHASRDIRKSTDVKGFRHPSTPSARSRMPAHTSLDGTFPAIPLARKCPTNRQTIAPKTALPYAAYTIRGGPEYRNRP